MIALIAIVVIILILCFTKSNSETFYTPRPLNRQAGGISGLNNNDDYELIPPYSATYPSC